MSTPTRPAKLRAADEIQRAHDLLTGIINGDVEILKLPPEETRLLCGYCRYFIHAPCWEDNYVKHGCEEDRATLNELRQRSKSLASLESIRRWIEECMELGLDPF